MDVGYLVEVDVDGEEIFMVDMKILATFSVGFSKLVGKLRGGSRRHKVIFHDFPGGAYGFELIARFCYNNDTTEINPSNIILLDCAAHFVEMGNNSSSTSSSKRRTEKWLDEINYWTWSELLLALKQSQDLLPATTSSTLLDKILDCLIGRLALPTVSSPFTCSSDTSYHLSRDSISTCSTRNNSSPSPTTWWFEDLLFLNVDLFNKVTRMMAEQKLEHALLFRFLIFYIRSRFLGFTVAEKYRITEVAINLLPSLDRSSLSWKGLFDILIIFSSLKSMNKCDRLKLENLTGSMLDQATPDHLLVPSPHRKHYIYDVNLVLRLVKAFLLEDWTNKSRLEKVSRLMDSYLIEVAPDLLLKPSKFAALATVLPDSARESTDRLYQAIDIYLQVHSQMCDKEKMKVCSALNRKKLSAETVRHLAQNTKIPSTAGLNDPTSHKSKIYSLIQSQFHHHETQVGFPFHGIAMEKLSPQEGVEQVIFYARKDDEHSTEIQDLDAKLQGMQMRVRELEKACAKIQSRMSNVTKPMFSSAGKSRSLPKLCS